MRACVRACEHACVRACVRVCVRGYESERARTMVSVSGDWHDAEAGELGGSGVVRKSLQAVVVKCGTVKSCILAAGVMYFGGRCMGKVVDARWAIAIGNSGGKQER